MAQFINWKNLNYIKSLKIALGGSAAIYIASQIGLQYSASAGIITLLSIQDTKKETLSVAFKRFVSFVVNLILAFVIFRIMGYNVAAFGVFLIFFINICYVMELKESIAIGAVLTTHFMTEKNMGIPLILNETGLLAIGVFIGILLNLYMPKFEKQIKESQKIIDEDIRQILLKMAEAITDPAQKLCYNSLFFDIDDHMDEAFKNAHNMANNSLLGDTRYYIQYISMRRSQKGVLKRIYHQIGLLSAAPPQAQMIADFIIKTEQSFCEYNNVLGLLSGLEELKRVFENQPLPQSREEFKNRAILLEIFYDLQSFINLKREFVLSLDEKQLQTYWGKKESV